MNRHHRLHVADKDTIPLKYIIHRIHPLKGTASTQGPYAIEEEEEKKAVYDIYGTVHSPAILSRCCPVKLFKNNPIRKMTVWLQGRKRIFTELTVVETCGRLLAIPVKANVSFQ